MHNNVWSIFYLLLVPAGLTLLIGMTQWIIKKNFPKKIIVSGIILSVIPFSFIIIHVKSENKEMMKRQGIYKVINVDKIEEICNADKIDSLQLILLKSGVYYFNFKPCFANKIKGYWKWQDDMVDTYAVFDIEIKNHAYLHFDNNDILRLIKEGRNYITFKKQDIKNSH